MLAGQKAAVEEQKPKSLTKILPKKEEKQKEEKRTLKRQSSNAAAELANNIFLQNWQLLVLIHQGLVLPNLNLFI